MVTDQQVRLLFKLMHTEPTLATAAAKAGMDEKTARKYRRLGKLPSETKASHNWLTREDVFADVWPEIEKMLETSPGLEAKTLFNDLKRFHPHRYSDGQLRTLTSNRDSAFTRLPIPLSLNHRAPETETSVQGEKKAANAISPRGSSQSRISAPTLIMLPSRVSPGEFRRP